MADAEQKNGPGGGSARAEPLPKQDPPGHFAGESMTRRKALIIASQAVGGVAGLAIVLPAVGFALAPIFDHPEEHWEGVGPIDQFTPGLLQADGDHPGERCRRVGEDDRLRPSRQP